MYLNHKYDDKIEPALMSREVIRIIKIYHIRGAKVKEKIPEAHVHCRVAKKTAIRFDRPKRTAVIDYMLTKSADVCNVGVSVCVVIQVNDDLLGVACIGQVKAVPLKSVALSIAYEKVPAGVIGGVL